ncbi:MAG: glycosyltransferase family 4 protein [Nitrospirae bacterium]|nr:glycosyltransferase family 4 protein [Nitrospirota bacterium]
MDLETQTPQGRLTIVLFTYDFPPFIGGISAYARSLAVGLGELGHEVHVVCPGTPWDAGGQRPYIHRFDATGSDFHRYRKGVEAMEEVLNSVRPDVLHAVSSIAHLALGRMETPALPRVMTVHGTELLRNLNRRGLRLRDRLFRPAYLEADRIICVSRFTRSLAESHGLPADKLHVVYNGVDTRPRYHAPEAASDLRSRFDLYGKKVILTIAHLHPRKGQMEVIRALPEILRTVPEAAYVMVGSGDSMTELKLEAHAMGLDGAVRFCGEAPDAAAFFAVADTLVLFSLPAGSSIEGFGLSVAEAMAEGVPVVVSNTGGLPEVVEHERCGLVVPHDHPELLAPALIRVLKEPSGERRFGDAGRQRARGMFSLARFTTDTLAVYQTALRGRV